MGVCILIMGKFYVRSKVTCKSLFQLLLAISITWHDFMLFQYLWWQLRYTKSCMLYGSENSIILNYIAAIAHAHNIN